MHLQTLWLSLHWAAPTSAATRRSCSSSARCSHAPSAAASSRAGAGHGRWPAPSLHPGHSLAPPHPARAPAAPCPACAFVAPCWLQQPHGAAPAAHAPTHAQFTPQPHGRRRSSAPEAEESALVRKQARVPHNAGGSGSGAPCWPWQQPLAAPAPMHRHSAPWLHG